MRDFLQNIQKKNKNRKISRNCANDVWWNDDEIGTFDEMKSEYAVAV